MDVQPTSSENAFRGEVRAWLEANVPTDALESLDTEHGFAQHRDWERRLGAAGWSTVAWPTEYGGRGVDISHWLVFEEEYYAADAPLRVNQNGIYLLGPTLIEYGTDEQKARFLPAIAAGEEIWAQGWSEPNAGSDMANIHTNGSRVSDGYVLQGQKTWVSRGAFADWLFALVRTDPDSTRHHGLTFVLVPLDAPGVTVRPIRQLDGEVGFAEVFFDDAHVPFEHVVGEVGAGWSIAMSTAGFERGLLLRSPGRYLATARRLVELYASSGAAARAMYRDGVVRGWMNAEAYDLHAHWTAARVAAGEAIGAEASLNKIFWSELDLDLHDTALGLLGGLAELSGEAPAAADEGRWLAGYVFALAGPIYAGTNQIQRNIVADRVLQLPRAS